MVGCRHELVLMVVASIDSEAATAHGTARAEVQTRH
jgi:hypothetical protein